MLALALLSSAPAASAGTAERSRRTTLIVDDGDSRRFYYRDRSDEWRNGARKPLPRERWSFRIGAGMSSASNLDDYLYASGFRGSGDFGLSDYYGGYHGPVKSSGVYSIGAEYLVARWFAVSADLSVECLWNDLYDGFTDRRTGRAVGTALVFMPQARFIYLNRPGVRLYGYIGAGFVKYFGYGSGREPYRDEEGIHFHDEDDLLGAGQIVPIGIELGRRFFGFFETGLGSMFTGVRAGAGFRF